ncbi:hypothetical protein C8R47DRAFT_221942 [Mycena vitilis]|nr:hypothetical protein C8R47DRAFT_221942 [Mycena vitilis]
MRAPNKKLDFGFFLMSALFKPRSSCWLELFAMPAERSDPAFAAFTAYSRFTPLLRRHLPSVPNYTHIRQLLRQWNDLGIPVTWCPFANDWVVWKLPMRVLKGQKRLVRVAASGFHKIEGLQAPRCPHTYSDPAQSIMTLHLNKVFDATGLKANFYRCDTHPCNCIVLIPDPEELKSQYITTDEEELYFEKLYSLDQEEEEVASALHHCTPSTAGSASTATSTKTSPTTSEGEVEEYLLGEDPRFPRLSDLPPAFCGLVKPYFNDRVASARKTVDLALMHLVNENDEADFYSWSPQHHPIAATPTHALMTVYDQTWHPACLMRIFSNLQHIDSHVGRAIREFHSPIGIPVTAWTSIIGNLCVCACCQCTFSIDGYNSHVVEGRCSMAAPMDFVPVKAYVPPRIAVRTYPAGYVVPLQEDYVDTPSGVAFMEWNSRIGVPMDVWAFLASSGVVCEKCKLRRSFQAHKGHCNATGECRDPGELAGTLAS